MLEVLTGVFNLLTEQLMLDAMQLAQRIAFPAALGVLQKSANNPRK